MKVLLVGTGRRAIPPTGYGGIERTITELARALERAGATVQIVNEIRPGAYTTGWAFERHLPRLIRGTDADVIHAHTSRAGVMLGLAGIPYVYTTHTPHWFLRQNPVQRALFQRERQSVRWAAATIALTPRLATVLIAVDHRPGPVVTIPLGVDVERFRARGAPEPHRALGVGTVEARKRWLLAAHAVDGTPIHLRVVGPLRDPRYAAALTAAGAEVVGPVGEEQLIEEFSRAEFVLHPSAAEVLSGAVLQALACGRPVIGGPAIDGVPGTICAPADDEATMTTFLRARAVELDADPERVRELGRTARAAVEREYAWPAVAQAHLELYRRVARSN